MRARIVIVGAALVAAGCQPLAMTLHPASAMHRLDEASLPPAAAQYRLMLARNEAEAFQVHVVLPAGPEPAPASPTPVAETPGPAASSAPATAPAAAALVRLAIHTQSPPPAPASRGVTLTSYQVLPVRYDGPPEHPVFKLPRGKTGWVPDVCWPTQVGYEAPVPERAARALGPRRVVTFLVDVRAAAAAPAGPRRYRLEFQRLDRGRPAGPLQSLDLTVDVMPFALPARLPFRTAVTWNWQIEKYLGRELTPQDRLAYLDFFLDHRLTPASFFSKGVGFSPDELRRVVERGGNVFQIYCGGQNGKRLIDDRQKQSLEPQLRAWREQMKSAGALGDCYALIADEPPPDAADAIRANAAWLKSVFPELKMWVASRPRAELMDVVDLWDVVTAHSTDFYRDHSHTGQALRAAHAAGREYWWFWSVEPYGPHPNCRLDDALGDTRAIGWLSWLEGVDGFEYFWATDWSANADLRELPWPGKATRWRSGLAGAGILAYPDAAGRPMPSLRLVNLRDAMEDWAAAALLGEPARRLAPANPRDPAQIEAARGAVYAAMASRQPQRPPGTLKSGG